jgi:CheY-like chemotaxis protein
MQKLKIFYIEADLDDVFFMLQQFSADPEVDVIHFENAALFWQYLQGLDDSELPQVILTDFLMPGLSGLELFGRIRSLPRFKDITLAIYSASDLPEHIADCIIAGADLCLQKPYTLDEYKPLVAQLKKLALNIQ